MSNTSNSNPTNDTTTTYYTVSGYNEVDVTNMVNRAEKKALMKGFIAGAVISGIVVSSIKNDSDTGKEIIKAVTKVGTSYYGCKFLFELFH